jgi:hypothetical protein
MRFLRWLIVTLICVGVGISSIYADNLTIKPIPATSFSYLPAFIGGAKSNIIWQVDGVTPSLGLLLKKCKGDKKCIMSYMQTHGASAQALEFYKASGGIIRAQKKLPHGVLLSAETPANFPALYLVNTSGQLLDLQQLSWGQSFKNYAKSGVSLTIYKRYPKAAVWPAYGNSAVTSQIFDNGNEELEVTYPVTQGCHACALIGWLKLALVFDKSGKIKGYYVADFKLKK